MKKMAVLQVTSEHPNSDHVKLFANQKNTDFFFVTHNKPNKAALKYCPNTSWAETRNVLAELVPKKYEYYAFIDEDYNLETSTQLNPREQICDDLDVFNPALLIPYPGKGNSTPLAGDKRYLESKDYSVHAFTHCGLKIIHHSLLKWFFPLVTQFDGWWSASHYFNILELPFIENTVVSHKIVYANARNSSSVHNEQLQKRLNMDKMWMWLRPYFNERSIFRHCKTITNAMDVKTHYVDFFNKSNLVPIKNNFEQVDYFEEARLAEFFDLDFKLPKSNVLVVMGNGPSLRQEYFELLKEHPEIDTIGMNSAYRYYKKMAWYPTYFCCYDYMVTKAHKNNWGKMILSPNVPIKKYFFIDADGDCKFPKAVRTHEKFVGVPNNQDGLGFPEYGSGKNKMSSTGVNAVRIGVMLGYKKIVIIGCDCNYVQELPGIRKIDEWKVQMIKPPKKNPNYFWDDYQQCGDTYNKPGDQLPVWRRLRKLLDKYAPDVEVVNCSSGSRIDCFRKSEFNREI